jgi:hypothetical protein
MPEEVLNKLHAALYTISPLASDRERIISRMGEIIWLETLEQVLSLLPEDVCANVVALLNEDKVDEAVAIMEATDIDVEAILTATAVSVMDDVTGEK